MDSNYWQIEFVTEQFVERKEPFLSYFPQYKPNSSLHARPLTQLPNISNQQFLFNKDAIKPSVEVDPGLSSFKAGRTGMKKYLSIINCKT